VTARTALLSALLVASAACPLGAQDLTPRAYVVTPVGSNAATLGYTYNDGEIIFDAIVPITDASGKLSVPYLAYCRSFGLLGRSANVLGVVPYGSGTFSGTVFGMLQSADRSGLLDASVRLSVNLLGAPAMSLEEFRQWKQETILGASLKVTAPTGQYDPTKLINLGTNRWAFKPELGYSRAWGHWILDGYASVWLFTENPEFFSHNAYVPGTQVQTRSPIGAAELHLSYDVRPRFWISLDGNFWTGGTTTINGVSNSASTEKNSRVGVTASVPVTRRQSVKASYAQGAYIRIGSNFHIYSLAWQYSWLDP
jgi:hypothetical protein